MKNRVFNNSPHFDIDSEFFFRAARTMDAARFALDEFACSWKKIGIWAESSRIYVFDPTSAESARYCMKTRTQFTYNNTLTWEPYGVTIDAAIASDGYLDSGWKWTGDTSITNNDGFWMAYSNRDFHATDGLNGSYGGSVISTTQRVECGFIASASSTIRSRMYASSATQSPVAALLGTNPTGPFTGSFGAYRKNSTEHKIFKDGTLLATATVANTGTKPNTNHFIGAYNGAGAPSNIFDGTICFHAVGKGANLTDAMMTQAMQAVNLLQFRLGRTASQVPVFDPGGGK